MVKEVGDRNVAVPGHEAQSNWAIQLTVAAAEKPKATKKSSIAAAEHTDAVVKVFGGGDNIVVSAHASRKPELAHANEAVEVECTRRQDLDALVASVCHKHVVIGRNPYLGWILELQRPVAPAADGA